MQWLVARRKWDEAQEALEQFVHRHPSHVEGLVMLGEVYRNQEDIPGLWEVTDRLVRLDPNEPIHWFNAAVACMAATLPFSALHYAHHFLTTWPDHDNADEMREIQATLEAACDAILASDATTAGATPNDLMLYEQSQMVLSRGDYKRGEKIALEAAKRLPHVPAPLNNLTLAYALQGRFDDAIQAARQVLERHPDNIHALSNLAQCLVRTGQREEAERVAGRLRALTATDGTLAVKRIEAFAYLGDDGAVCELYEEFEKSDLAEDLSMPMAHHLGAVAFARRGDLTRAKQLWKRALRLDRHLELARENLEDLRKPLGERSGAWPFSLYQWVPRVWIEKVLQATTKGKRSDAALKREYARVLRDIPALAAVISILLERGDPQGREFALRVAIIAELPLLREFALSANGTDQQRLEASRYAVEWGLLPRGKSIKMYTRGEWTEVLLFNYEIYPEAQPTKIPEQAQDLLEKSYWTLADGRAQEAEALAREALDIAPDNPTLLNHLAVALSMQRREKESEAVIRRMAELHPDYLFARCAMAQLCAREKRLEEARAWLDPVLERPRFHTSEFSAVCAAQVELFLAEGKPDGAQSWLKFWEDVDPDNPNIPALRRRLGLRRMFRA